VGDVIQVHVHAIFPDDFPLNYYWSREAGTLKGKGADMLWRPKDAAPGVYLLSARINDGHGNEAVCSIQVRVESNSAFDASRRIGTSP
jgi:hypothetical protein